MHARCPHQHTCSHPHMHMQQPTHRISKLYRSCIRAVSCIHFSIKIIVSLFRATLVGISLEGKHHRRQTAQMEKSHKAPHRASRYTPYAVPVPVPTPAIEYVFAVDCDELDRTVQNLQNSAQHLGYVISYGAVASNCPLLKDISHTIGILDSQCKLYLDRNNPAPRQRHHKQAKISQKHTRIFVNKSIVEGAPENAKNIQKALFELLECVRKSQVDEEPQPLQKAQPPQKAPPQKAQPPQKAHITKRKSHVGYRSK